MKIQYMVYIEINRKAIIQNIVSLLYFMKSFVSKQGLIKMFRLISKI